MNNEDIVKAVILESTDLKEAYKKLFYMEELDLKEALKISYRLYASGLRPQGNKQDINKPVTYTQQTLF